MLLLGTFLLGEAQAAEALPLLQRATETAARVGSQNTFYAAHRALSRASKQMCLLAEALEHFERYNEVEEEVVNEAA